MRCLGVQFYGNELRKHVGTVRTILKVHVSVSSHLAFYRVPAVLYHNLGFFLAEKALLISKVYIGVTKDLKADARELHKLWQTGVS